MTCGRIQLTRADQSRCSQRGGSIRTGFGTKNNSPQRELAHSISTSVESMYPIMRHHHTSKRSPNILDAPGLFIIAVITRPLEDKGHACTYPPFSQISHGSSLRARVTKSGPRLRFCSSSSSVVLLRGCKQARHGDRAARMLSDQEKSAMAMRCWR